MSDIHLTELVPRGLEYVFEPPGLPLVAKAADTAATTSILVRGGAGTGKTTIATGLAHAISRAHGGVALYLTTEFVATELAYKAAILELPKGCVKSWGAEGEHAPGTILVQHLLRTDAGSERARISTVVERKRAAIDAVWELVRGEGDGNETDGATRAQPHVVVIDAFGLPELERDDADLRNELLELIQSLELMGVTTIIVEEAGNAADAWLPFVVDVVFEIELWPDPETDDLIRRLKCPKSRYVRCLPGPHDYGLSPRGVPVVRPDLVFGSGKFARRGEGLERRPMAIVPFGDEVLLCPAGIVMTSSWDSPRETYHALVNTPGLSSVQLLLGPVQRLEGPGVSLSLGEGSGLFATVWELVTNSDFRSINTVFVRGAEYFLTRPRARIRLLRALTFLSEAGFVVCLRGRDEDLRLAHPIVDLIQANERRGVPGVKEQLPRLLGAERWLPVFAQRERESAVSESDFDARRRMLESEDLSELRGVDEALRREPLAGYPKVFERACTHHLLGQVSYAEQCIGLPTFDSTASSIASVAFRFLAFVGDYWGVANTCIYHGESESFGDWWRDLTTFFTGTAAAIQEIEDYAARAPAERVITSLRALSKIEDSEACSRLIDTIAERFELPDWYQTRLRVELIGPSGPEKEAAIEALAENVALPVIHRAELLYNLGVYRVRGGGHDGAREAFAAARALNPMLELPVSI